MDELLKPIEKPSAKDMCIARFEELILSGKLAIGQKLPPERDLASQLGVSRPIIHESLVDLASKGLVKLIPRVGAFVNDYRKEGSLDLLTSLLNYNKGLLSKKLLDDVLQIRNLIETECARLAALNRTHENINDLKKLIDTENNNNQPDISSVIEINFSIHHLVALSTGNFGYALLLNSFKFLYINLLQQYFSAQMDNSKVLEQHKVFHRQLLDAIINKDDNQSVIIMKKMLKLGEAELERVKSNSE